MDEISHLQESLTQTLRRVDLHSVRRPIELPSDLDAAIRRAHDEVDTMMARLADGQADASALKDQVTQVERLRRRVEAVQLRLTAQASAIRAHDDDGRVDPGSWLAGATGSDHRHAAGQAALADALGGTPAADDVDAGPDGADAAGDDPTSGEGPASDALDDRRADGRPRLTATGAALDAGTISSAHAQVIMRALDDLPERISDGQRRECEEQLLLLCAHRSPGQLRRAARRVLDTVEPDPEVVDQHEDDLVADEEERARERAAFWIKDNRDGTVTGQFTVPWVSGMMLNKVIDAMTAPRRQRSDDHAHRHGTRDHADADSTRTDRHLDWQHRRGLAFADLLTRIPTDHLHTKVSATLLITTRLSDLTDNLEGSGTRVSSTDMQDVLSAGATRRLACGAGLLPEVLDGDSVPLDLGRQRRLFTDHQRLALAGRYDECAAEGCDRPFAWTETHHLTPWQTGGRTDLDNAVPLCGTHHHMIDSSRWTVDVSARDQRTVALAFHRRT